MTSRREMQRRGARLLHGQPVYGGCVSSLCAGQCSECPIPMENPPCVSQTPVTDVVAVTGSALWAGFIWPLWSWFGGGGGGQERGH